jgi:hypothetical protein
MAQTAQKRLINQIFRRQVGREDSPTRQTNFKLSSGVQAHIVDSVF